MKGPIHEVTQKPAPYRTNQSVVCFSSSLTHYANFAHDKPLFLDVGRDPDESLSLNSSGG